MSWTEETVLGGFCVVVVLARSSLWSLGIARVLIQSHYSELEVDYEHEPG